MTNRTDIPYRRAFLAMLFTTIVLAIGMTGLWWRLHPSRTARVEPSTAHATEASQPAMQGMPAEPSAAASQPEVALAGMQLSPQRMQSIGVQTGTVEYKQLNDDLRATGTVDINERLLSYVQVRFPGYIRKVFASATYQYVRRGEPLFTI